MDSSSRIVFLLDVAYANVNNNQIGYEEIRLCCLRILFYFNKIHQGRFKWGFKFFNTEGSHLQKMDRFSFRKFNLEAFEDFEHEVIQHFARFRNLCRAVQNDCHVSQSNVDLHNVKSDKTMPSAANILKVALTQILCEYDWNVPEINSPVQLTSKKQKSKEKIQEHSDIENYVFILSALPNSSSIEDFVGKDINECKQVDSSIFLSSIMPRTLLEKYQSLANAKLMWIDLINNPSDVLSYNVVSGAFQKLKGGVIPLCSITQNLALFYQHLPSLLLPNDEDKGRILFDSSKISFQHPSDSFIHPMIPASVIIEHYMKHEWCTNNVADNKSVEHTMLCSMTSKNPLCALKVTLPHNISSHSGDIGLEISSDTDSSNFIDAHSSSLPANEFDKAFSFHWKQLIIKGYVRESVYLCLPEENGVTSYVCYPRSDSPSSDVAFYMQMIQQMTDLQIYMVVECMHSSSGPCSLALLKPLNQKSCILHMLKTPDLLHLERGLALPGNFTDTQKLQKKARRYRTRHMSVEEQYASQALESLSVWGEEHSDSDVAAAVTPSLAFNSQVFENWFVPNLSVTFHESEKTLSKQKLNQMLEKLQKHYQNAVSNDQYERKQSITNAADSSKNENQKSIKKSRSCRKENRENKMSNAKDEYALKQKPELSESSESNDDSKVICTLQELYNKCLDDDSDVITCAHTVVNTILHHTKCTEKDNAVSKAQEFVQKNFILSTQKIKEKYQTATDERDKAFLIKEYQLQTAITMECILLGKSEELATFGINTIVGFLRTMSFLSGPAQLYSFLTEKLKDNYCTTLKELLEEVGEELNVEVFPEASSPSTDSAIDSPHSLQSGQTSSVASQFSFISNNSQRSCHSDPMAHEQRKITRHPSLVFGRNQRQISVPRSIITRSKSIQLRSSDAPEVQGKPVLRNSKSDPEPRTKNYSEETHQVKRKLFSTGISENGSNIKASAEHKLCSSLKKRACDLTKKYAPRTPKHKEGLSVVARRLAQLAKHGVDLTVDVVEESPDKATAISNLIAGSRANKKLQNISTNVNNPSVNGGAKAIQCVSAEEKHFKAFCTSPSQNTRSKRNSGVAQEVQCALPVTPKHLAHNKHKTSLLPTDFDTINALCTPDGKLPFQIPADNSSPIQNTRKLHAESSSPCTPRYSIRSVRRSILKTPPSSTKQPKQSPNCPALQNGSPDRHNSSQKSKSRSSEKKNAVQCKPTSPRIPKKVVHSVRRNIMQMNLDNIEQSKTNNNELKPGECSLENLKSEILGSDIDGSCNKSNSGDGASVSSSVDILTLGSHLSGQRKRGIECPEDDLSNPDGVFEEYQKTNASSVKRFISGGIATPVKRMKNCPLNKRAIISPGRRDKGKQQGTKGSPGNGHNNSFTPPSALSMLHLTTSPIVPCRSKFKVNEGASTSKAA